MTVSEILKKKIGLSEREISRVKFHKDGILLKKRGTEDFGRVRISEPVETGDTLVIHMPDRKSRPEKVPPVNGAVDILYEDEDYIALSKPAGMVTHPTHGHHRDTLSNLLAGHFGENGSCKVIGRLDKETSGIVLFGKHRLSVSRLQRLQKEGKYEKVYLALALWEATEKTVPDGEIVIRSSMGKVRDDPAKQEIKEAGGGKEAITRYRVRNRTENAALLEVRTETGRTHQIRLHLASVGHPLLGDPLYGTDQAKALAIRTMLHAWKIRFEQPFTGEKVEITAPVPDDMNAMCRSLV